MCARQSPSTSCLASSFTSSWWMDRADSLDEMSAMEWGGGGEEEWWRRVDRWERRLPACVMVDECAGGDEGSQQR